MPPVAKVSTYDFNASIGQNLRQNFVATRLAQNRWGKKFARLYTKHMEATADNTLGHYDFTAGMVASVSSREDTQVDLDRLRHFRQQMLDTLQVETDGVWSIGGALRHSYFSLLMSGVDNTGTGMILPQSDLLGLRFSLSIEDGVDRRISWWHESGAADGTAVTLQSLLDPADTYGLHLISDDGAAYGHYDGGLRAGTTQQTVLSLYGVEDRDDARFAPDQEARFTALWDDLSHYAKQMVKDLSPTEAETRTAVMVGLDQFLHWTARQITRLEAHIDRLENQQTRVSEDLDLIDHLDLGKELHKQIADPGDIESIWFKFEKVITPPTTTVERGGDDSYQVADTDYAWWEEEQFETILKDIPYFKDYCVVSWQDEHTYQSVVRVRADFFQYAGWKIMEFVAAFLDIGVKMEEPSFWEKLLHFFIFVFTIYLTVTSGNPDWLKYGIAAVQTLNYLGVDVGELNLLVTVVSFSYGVYQTDFSAMSTMETLNFAVKSVSMGVKMMAMYEQIQLRNDLKRDKLKTKNASQLQDEAMSYIYSGAYSQYDALYAAPYDYDAQYKLTDR